MILQPKKAIMIQKQWIDKIFHQDPTKRKSWEVRSWNTHMRGTFAIGQTKANLLVGQVELLGTVPVGVRSPNGQWQPNSNSEEDRRNFIFNPANEDKVGFNESSCPMFLKEKGKLWAWIFGSTEKYPEPLPWAPSSGAVTFVNIYKADKRQSKVTKDKFDKGARKKGKHCN